LEEELRKSIIRYLLGGLSAAESDALAERYLDDDELFEEIKLVEEELIDSYLRGELTKAQRRAFETSYLGTPARRERVRSAIAFRQAIHAFQPLSTTGLIEVEGNVRRKTWLKFFRPVSRLLIPTMAVVIVFLAIGVTLAIIQNVRLQRRINQTQAEKKNLKEQERQALDELDEQKAVNAKLRDENQLMRNQSDQLRGELERLKLPPQHANRQSPDVSYELAFNLVRGVGSAATLEIPRRARLAELKLNFEPNDFKRFHIELQRADVRKWSKDFVRQEIATSRKQVAIKIPADLLSTGEYILTLSGLPNSDRHLVADYRFRVVRK